MDALIGRTGFVGQTLLSQRNFAASYRSTDIEEIQGRKFDKIVCAGVTAVKWWANANPEADLAGIDHLIRNLDRADCDRFILISTVDVYGQPIGVDEGTLVPAENLHPYGLHRARLEQWVARRYTDHYVIRLPALFGRGLKKNAIFDLLNDNRLEYIDPASSFQWYPLARLSDDVEKVCSSSARAINLVTEPVTMQRIQETFFPAKIMGGKAQPVSYDVRTRHANIFGAASCYMMTADAVVSALAEFLANLQ